MFTLQEYIEYKVQFPLGGAPPPPFLFRGYHLSLVSFLRELLRAFIDMDVFILHEAFSACVEPSIPVSHKLYRKELLLCLGAVLLMPSFSIFWSLLMDGSMGKRRLLGVEEEALPLCTWLSASVDTYSFLLPTPRAGTNIDVYDSDIQMTCILPCLISLQQCTKRKEKSPAQQRSSFLSVFVCAVLRSWKGLGIE